MEDKKWLKKLAFPKPEGPAEADDEEPKVERDYAVEVSGRRFDVKVIGEAFAGGGGNGAAPAAGPQAAQALGAQERPAAAVPTRSPHRSRATCGR